MGWRGASRVLMAASVVCALSASGHATQSLPGDANCDGFVTSDDIAQLQTELMDGDGSSVDDVQGGDTPSCTGVDVNGDLTVTAADLTALVNVLFGRGASAPSIGPVITFLGVAGADGTVAASLSGGVVPIFQRAGNFSFYLIVEVARGPGNLPIGTIPDEIDPGACPPLQVSFSRLLGLGSSDVCDENGVPALFPPYFGDDALCPLFNDAACHFQQITNPSVACTVNRFLVHAFVNPATRVQFCLPVTQTEAFADGNTVVTARVLDAEGNPGLPAQAIVHVGSGPPPTAIPTATITRTSAPHPTATRTTARSATATAPTSRGTPTATIRPSATQASPTASPPPSATGPSPSLTPTASVSPTARTSPTPTVRGTSAVTRTATASPSATSAVAQRTRTPTRTTTGTVIIASTRTRTSTPTGTPSPSASPTRRPLLTRTPTATRTATRTPTARETRTATRTPTATITPTITRTATISPTFTITTTATITLTPSQTRTFTATRSPTRTRTPSRTPTETRTPKPTARPGADINFVGVAPPSLSGVLEPDGFTPDPDHIPIYKQPLGYNFYLIVEGKPGPSRVPVGTSSDGFDSSGRPDLQPIVSQPLGAKATADVCDVPPKLMIGGVPASPSFDNTKTISAAISDLACRFVDGRGNPMGVVSSLEACTLFEGIPGFVMRGTTVQFCASIEEYFKFRPGDTLFSVELRDQSEKVGPAKSIIIRVPSPAILTGDTLTE